MDELVTVATFQYPNEVGIIRGRLESEGIECFTQDETIVQVNNFYSGAVGGIKLQVRRKDAEKAIELLLETGHLKEEDLKPSSFWAQVHEWTQGIPLINRLRVELRFMIAGLLVAGIATLLIFLL